MHLWNELLGQGALSASIIDRPIAFVASVSVLLVGAMLCSVLYRLSRSAAALGEIVEALDRTPYFLMDADGVVIRWSLGCEQLLGWSAAEAVGRNRCTLLQTRFDGERVDVRSLGQGQENRQEVTHIARDGRKILVLEGIRRLDSGKKSKPVFAVGITDITERVSREDALKAERALLNTIFETTPDAVIAFDEGGTICSFSEVAVQMLGYAPEEVLGKNASLIRPRGVSNGFIKDIKVASERLIGHVTRAYVRRKDGEEIAVEVRAAETVFGGDCLFVLFLRDLAKTIASEQRLSGLGAEFAHVARMSAMGELAAGIAHELNQPLTAIANLTGAASVLIDQGDMAQAHEVVLDANRQTLRAGEIIRRMRDFVLNGQVEMGPVAVRAMIKDAIALVFVGPTPGEINLSYELDPAASIASADRIQIEQVLVNLLRNSVEAMRQAQSEPKNLTISSKACADNMIEIRVSDSGPGIPEAIRANLFAPFVASGNKDGMGVGLSICRRIVEAHGGEICCEDHSEAGTTFRFTIPMFIGKEDKAL